METTRRSFFKIVAAVSAAAVLPLRFVEESEVGELPLGMLRELEFYDINTDAIVLQHDIRTLKNQLGVTHWITKDFDTEKARSQSIELLLAEMRKKNIAVSDLLPLDKPNGWTT